MNDLDVWQAANAQYLATSLIWLRDRLERLGAAEGGPEVTIKASPNAALARAAAQRSWFGRLFRSQPAVPMLPEGREPAGSVGAGPGPVPLPPSLSEAEEDKNPPALVLLSRRLGLSDFERQVLLLCAAMELDTRTGALCARAQRDPAKPFPTFTLALTLFEEDAAWDVMSPERPLRYWRLIEINQHIGQPLISSALRADERIVSYIKGLNYIDDRLAPMLMALPADPAPLPESQRNIATGIVDQLKPYLGDRPAAILTPVPAGHKAQPESQETLVTGTVNPLQSPAGRGRMPVLQLLGPDSVSKQVIVQSVAAELQLSVYRLGADVIPTQTTEHESLVRLWERESKLLPLALFLDIGQTDRVSPQASMMQRLVSRTTGVLFLDVREPWPDLGRESLTVEVSKPTPPEQRDTWIEVLGEKAASHAARLAGHFNFNAGTIRQLAVRALTAAAGDENKLGETLWDNCLRQARPTLDQLAQLLGPKAGWSDLVLPPAEKTLLRQIAGQVAARVAVYDDWGFRERMNRGLGISVLFAGESGTGKTMAAEVIARELGLLIYRIDLSSVVSKYIGETEKSLRRLFDAADDAGAILFFDEADALFGKRSEVKDSHDRYANIEISYLLQRMEAFRGLAILASNMKNALDSAFLRRLRFVVNFPFPGPAERMAIWQKAFPEKMKVGGLDFKRLARFNIAGGNIHNIALNAAFLAAQGGETLTMKHVLESARTEFRKLEKPVNEADFRVLEPTG